MALTITTPIDTILGILTDVIAAKSQALYGLAREDHQVDEVASFVTGLQVWLTGDFTSLYSDGDILFLSQITRSSDGALVCPAGLGLISGTPTFAGGFTKINVVKDDVVTTFPGVGIDGFINNLTTRANYRVEVELFDDTTLILDRTISFGLPQDGVEEIDIKSTLIDYMSINELQYVEYSAEFTEVWDGSSESATVTADLLAILGSKQILKTGGALMHEFLPILGTDAKFLTRFTNPTLWRGWKKTISYIIDSDISSRGLSVTTKIVQLSADINRVLGGSITGTISNAFTPARIAEVVLTTSSDVFNAVNITDNIGTSKFSEQIFIRQLNECQNPIMVEWINSLGAYEQHLFSINQEFINEGGDFENVNSPVIGNIDVFKGGKSRIVGPTKQRMMMFSEQLSRNDVRALSEIKNNEVVRVLLNPGGSLFVNTRVVGDTNTPFNSRHDVQKFSLELEFPDGFDFFDVIEEFSQDALDAFANMNTTPDIGTKRAMATLIDTLVADLNWADIDVFVFNLDTELNSLSDFKGVQNGLGVSAIAWSQTNGFEGDGIADHIDTQVDLSTLSLYAQDNASAGVFVNDNRDAGTAILMGVDGGGRFTLEQTGALIQYRINQAAISTKTPPTVFADGSNYSLFRDAGATAQLFEDGIQIDSEADASTSVPVTDFVYVLANNNGVSANNFIDCSSFGYYFGRTLTNMASFNAAIEQFKTDLGI